MHELSLCLSVLRIIAQQAKIKKYRAVKKIWLEIGVIAGVEKAAIQFSFPIAAKNTLAENAQLIIVDINGRGKCNNCGLNCGITQRFDVCLHCGYYGLEIISGDELRIQKLEVI